VLQLAVFRSEGDESLLRRAVGRDLKGKMSPVLYITGIGLTFVSPWLALGMFTCVALVWLVPDRRMERFIDEHRVERA
jgi:uncharacterized membrane protein